MEAKLQKLKVTELKEVLSKHNLPQTGKKDDLIKRLLDNNVSVDDAGDEELVDFDESPSETAPQPGATAPSASTAAPTNGSNGNGNGDASAELTPEQQAMKARAERFGMPFNPNASAASRPAKTEPAPAAASTSTPVTTDKPLKAGAIDKAPLGISDEVLAKRAAKFGIPEKKADPTLSTTGTATAKAAPAASKPEVELTPEMKEKIAVEEEKKRKRAEKFGLALPSNGTDTEPDAKKAKV